MEQNENKYIFGDVEHLQLIFPGRNMGRYSVDGKKALIVVPPSDITPQLEGDNDITIKTHSEALEFIRSDAEWSGEAPSERAPRFKRKRMDDAE